MLWKDKLCIGVEAIDEQHKELFEKTEELLREVHDSVENRKQECIAAILFLKGYAVKHFTMEEAYQKSIGYTEFDAHKKLHEKFVETVLQHEKKMVESDFAEKDVKEFTGMLIAWLLYHVSDSDQKIGEFARKETREQLEEMEFSHGAIIQSSVFDVLHKMAGLDSGPMKKVDACNETFDDAVVIEIALAGDISGFITLSYPAAFIKKLVYEMMSFEPETIGELELSALFEVSNIISGTVCEQIAKKKGIFCDMQPPLMSSRMDNVSDERVALDTGIGIIEADTTIEYM